MNKKGVLIFFAIIETVFLTIIILLFYLNLPIYSQRVLFIPEGSIKKIVTYLHKNNFEMTMIDKYLLNILGTPQSGWIDIGKNRLSKLDFLHKLTTSKAAMVDITLIPGETRDIFFKQSAEILNLDIKKLNKFYFELTKIEDGLLVPNTYKIPLGINEKQFVKNIFEQSMNFHIELSKKFYGLFDENQWLKILIIASIIQKEAANTKEMPIISAVIYNRLRLNMPLQMDGTLNYGIYSHTKVTSDRIKRDNSSYNTYKFKGLPKNPVGSVSKEAISAAIYPAKSDFLYFVKGKDGTHIFSKSYTDHINNIKNVTK